MIAALSRFLRPFRRRAFEGAAGGRRWSELNASTNLNAATFAGAATLRKRARHFAANSPYINAAARAFGANMIGEGIRAQSDHRDPDTRKRIDRAWQEWSPQADADGVQDLAGLQSTIAYSLFIDGEAFVRFRHRRRGDELGVPFKLQLVPSEQVDGTLHRDLGGGAKIRSGIEFDALGRRVAYHCFRTNPSDPLGTAIRPDRIPADQIAHIYKVLSAGQVRGVPALASAMLRLHELDQYEDASAVGQKVRALFAGFITDSAGDGAGFGTDAGKEIIEHGLEPGTLRVLPPGTDIKFSEPATGGDSYGAFVRCQLHAISAGLGIPYQAMTNDLSDVNFSSARTGLIQHRREIEALRQATIVHQFLRPTWRRFIVAAALNGVLLATDFTRDPAPWFAAKFRAPGWLWVDPKKDVESDVIAVAAGFKSRSEVIAARGRDPETVDAEIAADQARAKRLGLRLAADKPVAAPNEEIDDANA